MRIFSQRNKHLLTGLFCFLFSGFIAHAQQSPEAIIKYLSGKDRMTEVEWDFYCSDGQNSGEWTKIKVPSNWELEGFVTYNYGHDHKEEGVKYGKEHGLYKHEFDVPEDWKGQQVNIVFEGSMTDTEVQINGQLAGDIHQGAFYRFKYDISDLVQYGEDNLLEVKVSKFSSNESVNEAERHADYWIFGGIFRPVYLEVVPQLHFDRLAIDANAEGEVKVNAFLSEKSTSNSVVVKLMDPNGVAVGEPRTFDLSDNTLHQTFSTTYDEIDTWNPESPNLYWAAFDTDESDFKVYCESPDIYLKMYNPPVPDDARHAQAYYPEGDIAFLHYIPAIGTKFQSTDELGPSAQPNTISRRTGDVFKPLKLVFDFHANGE